MKNHKKNLAHASGLPLHKTVVLINFFDAPIFHFLLKNTNIWHYRIERSNEKLRASNTNEKTTPTTKVFGTGDRKFSLFA